MKVVKTQSRWNLHKAGFPVALRFEGWQECRESGIEAWLRDHLGKECWWDGASGDWRSAWGRAPNSSSPRPYYIGLRNEAAVTMILLGFQPRKK